MGAASAKISKTTVVAQAAKLGPISPRRRRRSRDFACTQSLSPPFEKHKLGPPRDSLLIFLLLLLPPFFTEVYVNGKYANSSAVESRSDSFRSRLYFFRGFGLKNFSISLTGSGFSGRGCCLLL